MNDIKKEFLFSIVITSTNDGELSYQVNPDLSVGLDPRNDIILISSKITPQFIQFEEINDGLSMLYLGEDSSAYLNKHPLFKNQKYILMANDIIVVDHYKLKIKKELGIRHTKRIKNYSALIENSALKNIHQSQHGLNFINTTDIAPSETFIRENKRKKISTFHQTRKKIKENNINLFEWKRVLDLIWGLSLDFYLAYFLLCLFPQIKIHLYFFFFMLEICFMFLFQSSFFQAMLKYQINRRVIVWGFLALFILFPLSKNSFTAVIKKAQYEKNINIDPHAYRLLSTNKNNDLNLKTDLDSHLIMLPVISDGQFGFYFIDSVLDKRIHLKFESAHRIDQLKNYFNRTNPLKLPIKDFHTQLSIKKYLQKNIHLNSHYLKEIILDNGPFIHFVNDTKNFFTKNLDNQSLEEIDFSDTNPIILIRDQTKAKVFFISNEVIYIFQYDRPTNQSIENALIEKILAKIDTSLIKSTNGQVSFLEMFDTLPQIDVQLFLDFMIQSKNKIIENNLFGLKIFYNQNLKESSLELKNVSRNAETIIADQITKLNLK